MSAVTCVKCHAHELVRDDDNRSRCEGCLELEMRCNCPQVDPKTFWAGRSRPPDRRWRAE